MSGIGTPVACRRTLAATTGRAGSKLGSARLIARYSSRTLEQASEVGLAPLAAGPLALLDDRVDRSRCRRQVGDGDELLPPEVLLGRLGVRRPDEEPLGSDPIGEMLETGLDRPVELADRVELLQVRDDLVALVVRQGDGLSRSPRTPRRRRRPCPRAARGRRSGGAPPRRRAAARSGRPPDSCRRASGSSDGRSAVRPRRPSGGSGRARGGASPGRRSRTASCASARRPPASPPTGPRGRAASARTPRTGTGA